MAKKPDPMPEVIQFFCPACGATLRVPLAAAGFQGPCPRCGEEIVGPDPALGLGARLAIHAAPPSRPLVVNPARADDPFNPFRKPPRPEIPAPLPPSPVFPPAPAAVVAPAPIPVEPPVSEPVAPSPEKPVSPAAPESFAYQPPLPIASPAPAPLPPAAPEPVAAPEPAAPVAEAAVIELPVATQAAETPPSASSSQPLPAATQPQPHPPRPSRAVPILSCALATLLGLMGGYFIGLFAPRPAFADKQAPESAPASLPQATTSTVGPPAAVPEPPKPEPQAEPGAQDAIPEPPHDSAPPDTTPPAREEPTPDDDEAPPLKIIPAPEAALKAFLSAPDWKSRALHVLHPEETTSKMEAYHATAADGPTAYTSLRADASHGDGEKNARLLSYLVITESNPDGFPVAIVETPNGWKVDWETFVEFRDDHFGRFSAGQGGEAGAFHVLVRNTHYFGEPFPGIEKLTAFRLDPPLPNRNQYAFVPTGSELHKTLAGSTEWGRPCAPVLQLVRKQHGDSKFHIEIEAILAPNWRPRE